MFGHCWVLVLQGQDVRPARARPASTGSRWCRTACCATRAGCCTCCCSPRRSCSRSCAAACTGGCSARRCCCCSRRSARGSRGGRIRLLAVPHYYLLVTAATLIALGEVATRGVAARLGEGGGHAMSAATSDRQARAGRRRREHRPGAQRSRAGRLRARRAARGRGPGVLPPGARRHRRQPVHGAEAAHDGRRRRGHREPATRSTSGDSRITRVGRLLRGDLDRRAARSSGTCCVGDMSLVGPRPTLAYQVERYTSASGAGSRSGRA